VLQERIQDKAFIDLMFKALKVGYRIKGQFFNSAIAKEGMSPILANVLLHKLDLFMTNIKTEFDIGKRHRINPEYKRL
jgi:hypothetical protein